MTCEEPSEAELRDRAAAADGAERADVLFELGNHVESRPAPSPGRRPFQAGGRRPGRQPPLRAPGRASVMDRHQNNLERGAQSAFATAAAGMLVVTTWGGDVIAIGTLAVLAVPVAVIAAYLLLWMLSLVDRVTGPETKTRPGNWVTAGPVRSVTTANTPTSCNLDDPRERCARRCWSAVQQPGSAALVPPGWNEEES